MPGRLRPFAPFNQLSAEQLIVAAGRTSLKRFRDSDLLLRRGSDDGCDYFLLDGNVVLIDADGNSRLIACGSANAVNALAPLRPCRYDVRALGPALCAKMARSEVAILRAGIQPASRIRVAESAEDLSATRDLFMELEADVAADRLQLPSLPDVAMRVRTAIADAACDNRRIADLLGVDPAIAAKILKVANSPLCRGGNAVNNLLDAVSRIGLYTIGELVLCFSLKDLFNPSSPSLRARFAELVGESVRVGACASVIGLRIGAGAEQALIAGLLCNIGSFALLDRLGQQSEVLQDDGQVERALTTSYAPRVGMLICKHWNLGDEITEAVAHAHDWQYLGERAKNLAEVVICARYHTLMALGKAPQLPKPEEIRAMRVLGAEVTPQISMEIIRDAKSRVDALLQTLN